MPEEPRVFATPLTHAELEAAARTLRWQPMQAAVPTWVVEGADARVTWHGSRVPHWIEVEGADADFIAMELRQGLPLFSSEDVFHAIAAAKDPQDVVRWAAWLGTFAVTEHDETLESVILGLIESGRGDFQRAVMTGLQGVRWPHLAARVAAWRAAAAPPTDIDALARQIEASLQGEPDGPA